MWKYVCWPCRMPGFLMRGTENNSNKRVHSRTSRTSRPSKTTETSKTNTIKTKETALTENVSSPELPEMELATSADIHTEYPERIQTDQPPAGINHKSEINEAGVEIVTADSP